MVYFGYFLATLLIALILTPIFRKTATQLSIFARPNHRTVHLGVVPKLGGASIYMSFVFGILLVWLTQPARFAGSESLVTGLLVGSGILFVLGLFDDIMELSCHLKLGVEVVAAFIVVYMGWQIESIVLPGGTEIYLGVIGYPLTILWIVGIANAVNLVDGLDGLAGGIALVAAFVTMSVAAVFGNPLAIIMSIVLAGSLIGFLRYNINPAKIFMGDSGSLSLGLTLACIAISGSSLKSNSVAMLVPILILGIPITDTLLAIVRRVRRGIHPFHADREHIHHRLLRIGLSQAGAAMFMVAISGILGLLAFLLAYGLYIDLSMLSHVVP